MLSAGFTKNNNISDCFPCYLIQIIRASKDCLCKHWSYVINMKCHEIVLSLWWEYYTSKTESLSRDARAPGVQCQMVLLRSNGIFRASKDCLCKHWSYVINMKCHEIVLSLWWEYYTSKTESLSRDARAPGVQCQMVLLRSNGIFRAYDVMLRIDPLSDVCEYPGCKLQMTQCFSQNQ